MKIFARTLYSDDELALIEREHLKAYLRLFRSTVIVQTLFPLVLAFVFHGLIPDLYLFSWLGAILVLTAIRGYVTFVWFDIDSGAQKTERFERLSLALSLVAGCFWGITVLVMDFSQYPEESVFLNIIVFGLIVGSTGIGSYWVAYFLIYNLTVFSVYISAYLIGIPAPYYLLALSLALFLGFMLQIVLVFHRSNVQNIWLAIHNEKLAENLESKKNQAEEFAASRTRFLAAASHDLRQPLQALNFFLTVLKPNLESEKSLQLHEQLEYCTEGINSLLNSMLDISKLDADTLVVNKTACSLANLLDSLEKQFIVQAKEKGLSFSIEKSDVSVLADPVLLKRILSNLLSNAVSYTSEGEVRLELEISDALCVIHIKDTGAGIGEDQQGRIFEEFYQLHNPERDRRKGLGLGLSIVNRLCTLMDIPLELESEPGKGSCFTVSLPVTEAAEEEDADQDALDGTMNAQRVLVIDDEISVSESLAELLRQWQYQVVSAESEEAALSELREQNFVPDLIISDYRLRDNKTGVEAVEAVHKALNDSEIPVVIISGDTEPARLQEVAQSGYILLHKPVKPAQLRVLMGRLFN